MAGRKRVAAEDPALEKRETRSSKVAKTAGAKTAGRAAKGTARLKTSMGLSAFKSRAPTLYVTFTTTPLALEGQEGAPIDPGLVASAILPPGSFQTGSYGWKTHKRITVELPHAEGEGEEAEKVHCTLTINATVIGSKYAKEGEEHEGPEEHVAEETISGEASEPQPEASPGVEEEESKEQPSAVTGEEHTEESAS